MSGGTNKGTRTTGHTYLRLDMKRGIHLHFHTPPGQTDGAVAHFLTDTGTKTAKDAGVIF